MSFPEHEIYWLYRHHTEYFAEPSRIISAFSPGQVKTGLREVEAAAEAGCTAVGFLLYEAAGAFDPAMQTHPAPESIPLMWFAVYDTPPAAVNVEDSKDIPCCHDWRPVLSQAEYELRFNLAREYIGQGDIYQVNLTFPFRAEMSTDDFRELFFRVAEYQVSDYRCYIRTPFLHIASLSPELFFSRDGARVTCRPMKGTAPRGRWLAEDTRMAEFLRASEKERAENLMIVDLVRNDLGRVAATGTVEVPELFSVERYQTLWQMTSTVTADIGDTPTWKLLNALFPCGSVTGAPKIRAMEIIRELEQGPRGVYCGALGRIGPGRQAVFSVPIRTLTLNPISGEATYHVGSGVTWDAVADGEYQECSLKIRVLTVSPKKFSLLETMRWNGRYFPFLAMHLRRLRASAVYFGFPEVEEDSLCRRLEKALEGHPPARVRLVYTPEGTVSWEVQEWVPWPSRVMLALAKAPVEESEDRYLFHKTTCRDTYRKALEHVPEGTHDAVLWNSRGHITETTRANIAVRFGTRWYPPPVEDGLLPGIMRERLLTSGFLHERSITVEELYQADELMVFNSVRGCGRAVMLEYSGESCCPPRAV